ncbi:MAG: heme-degrading monooxygenase HmoA [Candidatus Azotimanducaceae bacterium]|jgi:heme-degrading monooxygenase HmoA
MIATTPTPPYYAVIFTSIATDDSDGYDDMAQKMVSMAAEQPGFLGVEAARQNLGVTVSYWTDLDAIKKWKSNEDHMQAQQTGRDQWYKSYKTRIAKVERDYGV